MRYTDTEVIAGYVLTGVAILAIAGIMGGLFYALVVLMMAAI